MHAVGHCVPKRSFSKTLRTALLNRSLKPVLLWSSLPGHFSSLAHFSAACFFAVRGGRKMSHATSLNGCMPRDELNLQRMNGVSASATSEIIEQVLRPKKITIVGKVTRYEFEKHRFDGFSEEEFKEALTSRGSDYEALLERHQQHQNTMRSIITVLQQRGIEYQVCTRGKAYTSDSINWADAIITAGGDGTFLSAASKVKDQSKPVIGINTHPNRSEGHLCLPPKYTTDLGKALDKLAAGQFRWLWRQRIRITMTGSPVNFRPVRNGDVLQSRMSNTALPAEDEPDYVHQHEESTDARHQPHSDSGLYSQILSVFALNEVFIGESLAAVPSYYDLKVDDSKEEEQKSSGLCVCTGTGSTAWSYNICRLHDNAVRRIIEIATASATSKVESNGKKAATSAKNISLDDQFIKQVAKTYSQSYIFEPDSDKMLYSVRDPMQNRVFTCENCNGFAKKLVIRSRCWDASLCIDGEISFAFNDGAVATLEMLPEDALRTVVLMEDDDDEAEKAL